MLKKITPWLLSVAIIVLDQVSKVLANNYLVLGFPKKIFAWLNFTLAYNKGAAFSFLYNAGTWHTYLLAAISWIFSIVLVVWLLRTPIKHTLQRYALALVLAGAVGNLIDRTFAKVVTDFIDFHIGAWHFATFNVADSAISVGVVLLLLTWLKPRVENA